jgi:hypothetical protein
VAVKIDRDAQRKILEALRDVYPARNDMRTLQVGCSDHELSANVRYLEEQGLIDAKWAGNFAVANLRISAKGLDFLTNDGGLSAILGVVTVRLHEDTLKALLVERVDASAEPDTVKSKIKEQIRALPAEGIKTITMELLKGLLARAPDALPLLQRLLAG